MDKSEKTTESTSFFSFKDFDKKKLAILLPLIFILITALVAYDLRSGQAHLDGLRDNVERNVYSQVEQMIRQDVEVENRFASTQQKDRLVQQRMADVRRTSMLNIQGESINVEAVIDQQFEATKRQFQTDDGQTYLVAIDPHYFLKLSENYYFNE